MVFAISNWAAEYPSLDWLQHGMCEGTCSRVDTFSRIKNMSFKTASFTPPDTTVYKYGDSCGLGDDTSLCGEDCRNCQMSWPTDDPLGVGSDNAACRCLPDQRAAIGYTYSYQRCASDAGICDGCSDCFYSYPSDDPLGVASAEGMCRCKPQDTDVELHYGKDCHNLYDMMCGADCHDCRESWPAEDPRKWYSDDAFCRCKAE